MPQYKKVFDIGTYTGNGTQYRVGIPKLSGVGPTGTQVAGSTRWRSSAPTYLSRTPASAGNRKTWTWSFWIKRGALGTNQEILVAYAAANDAGNFEVRFSTTDQLFLYGWSSTWRTTTQVFKDTSTWQHIIIAADTTLATANDRIKIYVNGAQITSFATITNPTQNADLGVNSAAIHRISGNSIPDGLYFDGYLSQMYMIDGQQLTPSSFGEYNSDGIWVPKAYSGTYGTNGFYLPMNSSSNYATDQSGNGNNWTPTGFNVTTSNTTYDIVTDSPTDYGTDTGTGAQVRGNYAIMASIHNSGSQASVINGGLTATKTTSSGYYNLMFSSLPLSSGKWYWEVTIGSTGDISIGITTSIAAERTAGSAGTSSSGYVYHNWNGQKRNNGTSSAYGSSSTQNDVIGVALDMDNGTLTFYKNNVSQGTAFTGITGTAYAEIGDAGNTLTTGHMNFGQRAFAYTAPSGFKAVCTANITRPADSSLWFYGDTPDLMWIKNRSTTGYHILTDTVRGMGLHLNSNTTGAENSGPAVTEMNKFGMTVLNEGTYLGNGSGNSHVYWTWKAGSNTSSTAVSNASGNASNVMVSSNPAAGFSIVSYSIPTTGSMFTVGHGLGTAPSFIIQHARNTTSNWQVYHSSLGAVNNVWLNLTNASSSNGLWNSTSPTSSVFSINNSLQGASVVDVIAYCWAAIPGYSAFGSYTGNGSTDGSFVYLGFRPRWIMWKRTDTTSAWFMYDAVRQTYNVMGQEMYADTTSAEGPTTRMDFLSNGFKLRAANAGDNASGGTYVYAAFAEIPFKYARAR